MITLDLRNASNSHLICSWCTLLCVTSKFARLGFNGTRPGHCLWISAFMCVCQSIQPEIPPAMKTIGRLPSYVSGHSIYDTSSAPKGFLESCSSKSVQEQVIRVSHGQNRAFEKAPTKKGLLRQMTQLCSCKSTRISVKRRVHTLGLVNPRARKLVWGRILNGAMESLFRLWSAFVRVVLVIVLRFR